MVDHYSSLRTRNDRDGAGLSRRPIGLGPTGQPSFVGQVFAASSLPTTTGVYYSVRPVGILGTEGEGDAAAFAVDTSASVLVCVLGSQAPALGDNLVCRFEGNRWVAERHSQGSGSGGATIAGCACASIPATLRMSSSGPCTAGDFIPCSLLYGPTPPELSMLDLGANCFLSTETFTATISGRPYRYTLGCSSIIFRLSRVYLPIAGQGGAYHDATLFSWAVGLPGNTSSPFLLSSGWIYQGGNPNCNVTISQ